MYTHSIDHVDPIWTRGDVMPQYFLQIILGTPDFFVLYFWSWSQLPLALNPCNVYWSWPHWPLALNPCNVFIHFWFGWWFVECLMPSHYLNQCYSIFIWTIGTNVSEILIAIYTFSLKKMHFNIYSRKWRPSWLGPSVLNVITISSFTLPETDGLALTHWDREKRTPFRRRHFQTHFLEWKYSIFD